MRCFFGHKFGKIDEKGYQYCERCGKAYKPDPCENGHTWKDTGHTLTSTVRNIYGQPSVEWIKISQQCVVCGEYRSVEKY